MIETLRTQLMESMKAGASDLLNLAERMSQSAFEFGEDERDMEYLEIVIGDHFRAEWSELSTAIANHDWHEVSVYAKNIQALSELVSEAQITFYKKRRVQRKAIQQINK
jgi:hypothetical protein